MTLHGAVRCFFLSASVFAGMAHAAPVTYVARLSGAAEVPANASAGSGAVEVQIDVVAHTLRVSASFTGLMTAVTAAHIHCCSVPTMNAGIATTTPTFQGFPSGVTSGSYSQVFDTTMPMTYNGTFLSSRGNSTAAAEAALAEGMANGLSYFNLHTISFPGGELRGQLLPQRVFADGFEGGPI